MQTVEDPHMVKARKSHICNFCWTKIEKWELYEKATYVEDGIYSWKSHKACSEIANKLGWYEDCYEEWLSGNSWMDAMIEAYRNVSEVTWGNYNLELPNKKHEVMKVVFDYHKISHNLPPKPWNQ